MKYAGRVYDGPLEGEHRTEDQPVFTVNFDPYPLALPYWTMGMRFDERSSPVIYRLLYRWSHPLRAWVFDWTTAPPPRKQRKGRSRGQLSLS